jgi:hypothetical protein
MSKATDSAGKTAWHICDDCLDPLVAKLTEIVRKWNTTRGHLPSPESIGWIYKEHDLDFAITWLKLCESVEFAKDLETTLLEPVRKFRRLDFRACQILNGDDKDATTTITCKDAIARVVERRYEQARRNTPDEEYFDPDKDEVLSEILNPLAEIESGFRDAVRYLRQVSVILRTRISKANIAPPKRDKLLDLADLLTRQAYKIVEYLWDKRRAGFDELPEIHGAFRWAPGDDETIIKALNRTQEGLNTYPEVGVSLSFSKPDRCVKLIRPPDK